MIPPRHYVTIEADRVEPCASISCVELVDGRSLWHRPRMAPDFESEVLPRPLIQEMMQVDPGIGIKREAIACRDPRHRTSSDLRRLRGPCQGGQQTGIADLSSDNQHTQARQIRSHAYQCSLIRGSPS